MPVGTRIIRAPRGSALSCRGWLQEAAFRMRMNNLDPDVAEKADDLIVYGGSGKAARGWPASDAIVASLRRGLTMLGQMTAGSWIYIGTQGILQGTYETFASAGRRHFGGSLAGRTVVTAGLGGMGGAQPLAATMNGAAALVIEVDRERIARRRATRDVDESTSNLDEALDRIEMWKRAGTARSIAVEGNAADVLPEILQRGIVPDVLTDQTSAHDALNGYVPRGMSLADAVVLREHQPEMYIERAMASMARHVDAMLALRARGAVTFDCGNNIRTQAKRAGVETAFDIPGFVPEYVRPLCCWILTTYA